MQPLSFILPVLFAIFLWWFTTGLIIVVYGRSARLMHLCFVGATMALLFAFWGLIATRPFTHPVAIYLAFTCGLVIWGWQTASYYLGYVKGPGRQQATGRNRESLTPTDRFWRALWSGIYHELLVVVFVVVLAGLTWPYANRWGFWIFVAMWLMHSSAKLNVFLGVRNFRMEFLPSHLHHLGALLNKQTNNAFFPISVVVASTVTLFLFYKAIEPGATPSQTIGSLLVATMMGLGVIEHLLLILPIPATLYGWGIRPLPPMQGAEDDGQRLQSTTLRVMPKQMVEIEG